MLKGLLTIAGLFVIGFILLAVISVFLLPVFGLVTALLIAAVKLAFLLTVVYFIVKLVSPETADRALDRLRRAVGRAA